MENILIPLISLLLFNGCAENKPDDQNIKAAKSYYAPRIIPDDSLKFYTYRTEEDSAPAQKANFEGLEEFPDHWIKLSYNHHIGFFIHKRSAEPANMRIDADQITLNGRFETIRWPVYSFKKGKVETYFINYEDSLDVQHVKYKFEILDRDTLFALEESEVYAKNSAGELVVIMKYRNLCIPAFNKHLFNHIDEPNKRSPDSWVQTHEIDIAEFRKRKMGNLLK